MAGSSIGGRRDSIVGGVLGAVAGAVIGNAVERTTTREESLEILVQLRNGERRAVVQAKGNETFNPGDAVIMVTTGSRTRRSRYMVMIAFAITAPLSVVEAVSIAARSAARRSSPVGLLISR